MDPMDRIDQMDVFNAELSIRSTRSIKYWFIPEISSGKSIWVFVTNRRWGKKRRSKRQYKHKNNGKILLCGHFSRILQGIKRSRGSFCWAFLKKASIKAAQPLRHAVFFVLLFFPQKKVNGANDRNWQGGRKPDEVLSRKRKQPTESENCDWLSRQSAKRRYKTQNDGKP